MDMICSADSQPSLFIPANQTLALGPEGVDAFDQTCSEADGDYAEARELEELSAYLSSQPIRQWQSRHSPSFWLTAGISTAIMVIVLGAMCIR